jgi:ubiquinone/menaquinone biosynthesis C-methylase UbiE
MVLSLTDILQELYRILKRGGAEIVVDTEGVKEKGQLKKWLMSWP